MRARDEWEGRKIKILENYERESNNRGYEWKGIEKIIMKMMRDKEE